MTKDLGKRLRSHNWGSSIYIKKYRPWSIIHKEFYSSRVEAREREKYFKSAAGRRWMKKNLFK